MIEKTFIPNLFYLFRSNKKDFCIEIITYTTRAKMFIERKKKLDKRQYISH